jgi:hypothetical protein
LSTDKVRAWRKANAERDAELNRRGKRRRRWRAGVGRELAELQEDAHETEDE